MKHTSYITLGVSLLLMWLPVVVSRHQPEPITRLLDPKYSAGYSWLRNIERQYKLPSFTSVGARLIIIGDAGGVCYDLTETEKEIGARVYSLWRGHHPKQRVQLVSPGAAKEIMHILSVSAWDSLPVSEQKSLELFEILVINRPQEYRIYIYGSAIDRLSDILYFDAVEEHENNQKEA